MGLNERVRKLEQRLDATEQAYGNLVKAFNDRREVIFDGFAHYDQHMWVLHLMMQDAAHVKLQLWPPHADVVREVKREKAQGDVPDQNLVQYLYPRSFAAPNAMIDMDWYLQRYKTIRGALHFVQLLHNVAFKKEQKNGTGS